MAVVVNPGFDRSVSPSTPSINEHIMSMKKHSKLQGKRSESPAPSCISMKSDQSMDPPLGFKDEDSSLLHRMFYWKSLLL
ncbi:hypothetical protein QTP70_003301 [Hemibagrus guttatus]|uniref:Uncharacterized protein n=1 Tax=Hemibagrus guttatus TaxID=175788 RepID=A0AAE0QBL3_9TELE|nr:hypothetical protein QTP70_003301 [Hemibagrus guttatus]